MKINLLKDENNEWNLNKILKLAEVYPSLLNCIGNDIKMSKEIRNK